MGGQVGAGKWGQEERDKLYRTGTAGGQTLGEQALQGQVVWGEVVWKHRKQGEKAGSGH